MRNKLAALGIVCLLPFTMAAGCDTESPKQGNAATVVRKQIQDPTKDKSGEIKVKRYCIIVRQPNGEETPQCSEDPGVYYDKYRIGQKYP